MKEIKSRKKRVIEDEEEEEEDEDENNSQIEDTRSKKRKKRRADANHIINEDNKSTSIDDKSDISSSEDELLQKLPLSKKQQQQSKSNKSDFVALSPPLITSTSKSQTTKPSLSASSRPKPSSRSSLPTIKTTTATSPIIPLRRTSITSASTTSRRSPTRPTGRAASSASSYTHHTSHNPSTGSSGTPFRVLGGTGGKAFVQDILPNASLGLGFDNEIIDNGGKGKGKVVVNPGAKIDSLADATSFISYTFARGSFFSQWTGINMTDEMNSKGTEVTIRLHLFSNNNNKRSSLEFVKVTASLDGLTTPELLKKTKADAELCAKFELIRAIVSPSSRPKDFISDINSNLASYIFDETNDDEEDEGFADDVSTTKISHGQEMDSKGKQLFYNYRRLHPRIILSKLENRFKHVGSLDFQEKCVELVELFEKATKVIDTIDGDQEKTIGFGSWEGEITTSLSKILGAIEAFCLKNPDYYPIAVSTMAQLLKICTSSDAGDKASEVLHFWCEKCKTANTLIDQEYLKNGKIRKTPIVIQADTRKIITKPKVIVEAIKDEAMPMVKKEVVRKDSNSNLSAPQQQLQPPPSEHIGPTVDPRKRRISVDPLPTSASNSLHLSIPSPILSTTFSTSPSSFSTALPSPSPIIPRLVTTPVPISDEEWQIQEAERRSNKKKSLTSHSDLHRTSILPSIKELSIEPSPGIVGEIGLGIDTFRQAPTPEATPEAEVGLEYVESYTALSGSVSINQEKRITRLEFKIIDKEVISKLSGKIDDDVTTDISKLPYRAFAVFRTEPEIGSTWPSVQLSVNSNQQSFTCFPPNTPMMKSQKTQIPSEFITIGENKVSFVKWQNQILPTDLTLTIEIYVAYSSKWIEDQVQFETDDRVFCLYNEHIKLSPPVPISLHDPTTGDRKVKPVRSLNCNHFQTFDLDSHVQINQIESRWTCPFCGGSATPSNLRICGWTSTILSDVAYSEEHEIVPAPFVSEEVADEDQVMED